MSGGHWDHSDSRAYYELAGVFEDKDFENLAGEKLTSVAAHINSWVYDVTHDIDWHLSGDTIIDDLPKWRAEKLDELKKILKTL